jgi:hypothetical protein
MGKCSNAFFSETTNMVKAKLYMNVHWNRHKKQKLGKGHSNDHSFSLGSVSSLVSEKKIFEISVNQSILLALAAILNIRLERKTVTMLLL